MDVVPVGAMGLIAHKPLQSPPSPRPDTDPEDSKGWNPAPSLRHHA